MRSTADSEAAPRNASRIRLDRFDAGKGLDRGASRATEAAWCLIKWVFFLSPLPWPQGWKSFLLRRFGARVGRGVVIKPRVNIHLPWKLTLGDHVWLGEEVFLLNLEPVLIHDHACLSQRAFLCTGNHDYRDAAFGYRNAPITIEAGAWVGAQAFVGPGVTVAFECVVTAGSIVTRSLPQGMVCSGHPCRPVRPRWSTTGDKEKGIFSPPSRDSSSPVRKPV